MKQPLETWNRYFSHDSPDWKEVFNIHTLCIENSYGTNKNLPCILSTGSSAGQTMLCVSWVHWLVLCSPLHLPQISDEEAWCRVLRASYLKWFGGKVLILESL